MRDLLRLATGLLGIFVGMGTTIVNVFRPKVTLRYPYQRVELGPRYRGMFWIKWNEEKQRLNCTGCMRCAQACPTDVISMNKVANGVDEFRMDLGRCLFCNLCVEACPYDAIHNGPGYEFVATRKDGCVRLLDDLAQGGKENADINRRTMHEIAAAKAAKAAASEAPSEGKE